MDGNSALPVEGSTTIRSAGAMKSQDLRGLNYLVPLPGAVCKLFNKIVAELFF